VVVVHGGPGVPSRQPWPGLQPLTDRYRFHFYHQRGCGDSTRPFDRFEGGWSSAGELTATLGVGAQVADIERIRRILGEEAIILVGHSYGGLLASLYAYEFPERVAALVLIAPANLIVMPPEEDMFAGMRQRLPEHRRGEFDRWRDAYMDFSGVFDKSDRELAQQHYRFLEFFLEVAGPMPGDAAHAPVVDDVGGFMVWGQYMSLGLFHDWSEQFSEIASPTLLIHGSDDLQPEAVVRRYEDLLRDARVEVIDGAGHFPQLSHPDELAARVGSFLDAR
jgi:proline iminopeptidase